jgi:alanine racemase
MTILEPTVQPNPAAATASATPSPSGDEAGGVLTIDLGALEANWKRLSGMTIPVECGAVVKADAYGCGLEAVVAKLGKAGCKTFFVADVGEGRRVRAVARESVIYVLDGVLPNTGRALADAYLRPVVNSTTELAEWDTFVATNDWRGGAALHIDTGMNRLGLTLDEGVAISSRVKSEGHGFTLLMSHFACADTPDHPLNDKQIRLFRELRIMYRGVPSSLANSSGIFLGGTVHCDLVRPGIALYGGNPTPGKKNPMRPVVELRGRVIQVRHIPKGETVGYGAAFTTARPSRLATIAVGYGDGFARAAGAGRAKPPAEVIIAGRRCPLVGRISMDLMMADVTDLPDGSPRRGDLATLIGGELGLEEVGASIGTISYEVLTSLGRRYHRIYKGA